MEKITFYKGMKRLADNATTFTEIQSIIEPVRQHIELLEADLMACKTPYNLSEAFKEAEQELLEYESIFEMFLERVEEILATK